MAGGAQFVRVLVGGGVCRNRFMAAARSRQAHSGAFPSSKAKSKGKSQPKKLNPLPTSQLGMYLGIPEVTRSETSVLLAKFIKIHTRQVNSIAFYLILCILPVVWLRVSHHR